MEHIEPFHKKLDHLVIRALVSLSKDCALKSWASQSTGWYPGNGFCILGLIDIVKFLSFLGVKIVASLLHFDIQILLSPDSAGQQGVLEHMVETYHI